MSLTAAERETVITFDGSPWELIAGVDFGGKPTTFATNARQQGAKRGGRVRVRHFQKEQPERLVIQFVKE